jgi:elongation factor G
LDTPGFSDFVGEVEGALRVTDNAVFVVNAVSGIEVGTESVWKSAVAYELPRLLFVNRMNKEHADLSRTVSMARDRFGEQVVQLQLPVNAGIDFTAFVDLIKMQLVTYESNGSGKYKTASIPENLKGEAEELHEKLVELAAENDDELIEKFFEEGTLSDEELRRGLSKGITNGAVVPVLCGAADANIGVRHVMDFSVEFLPPPENRPAERAKKLKSEEEVERPCSTREPLAMLVFKTVSEKHMGELSFFKVFSGQISSGTEVLNADRGVHEKIDQIYVMNGKDRKEVGVVKAGDIAATVKLKDTHTGNTLCDKKAPVVLKAINFPSPVIRIAVQPKAKGDEQKISTGLHTLHEQDPTFVASYDPELRQTIISGQGEMHLDVIIARLKEKFGVDVELVEPRIPYRETIKGTAEVQGKYKKQSGGRGQYGDVWIRLEPVSRGDGFEFVNAIVGGVIPGKFIPAVEKGIRETMEGGAIAGYHVQDVKVTLYDGSYHNVDSSEMAFKVAGSMAFKKAFKEAKPILLEPIFDVEVVVPEEYMGDVMGDLSGRRGKISGMDSEGHFQIVKAKVPLAELYKYSTTLRSLTHGRGLHRRKFSHYEEVPHDIANNLIAAAQKED